MGTKIIIYMAGVRRYVLKRWIALLRIENMYKYFKYMRKNA